MDFRQTRFLSMVSVFMMAATAFFLVSENNRRASKINFSLSGFKETIPPEMVLSEEKTAVAMPLAVPQYIQRYRASCEVAAARAALLYFGVSFSEDDMIEEIGWEITHRYYDKNGDLVWGNPQSKYVGYYDPERIYIDGYGVYNQPIYGFLSEHGFGKSISKTNWSIDELISYVRQGYPAIAWVSGDFKKKAVGVMIGPDGVKNPWIFSEHAVVVRGFDEKRVYLMDPAPGAGYRQVTWKEFEDGFGNLDNMAIAIIPGEMAEL